MSLPTLGSQSSTLGTFTPTFDLTTREHSSFKPALHNGFSWTAPFRDGLPTPPSDMTGLAYNAIPSMPYGGKTHGMPSHVYGSRSHFDPVPSSSVASYGTKPQTHPAIVKEVPATEPVQKKSTGTFGGTQLRIPSSINNSKGNLAEFAAQMTCLFWFEKTSKLQAIEDQLPLVPSLVPEAIPTVGFQKWVATILSTTQVSQNVILLALLFIYRLKKFNSGVKGKKGSEFRLMTVALMLGNKFLDDNTYTNKTWAEVSGIAVQEIHIMEVEFLSNIRYDLFASEAKWAQWHTKLGLFADYFNRASALPAETDAPLMRVSPPRLQPQSPLSKLPSPPSDALQPQSQPNWYMPAPGLPYPIPSPACHAAAGSLKRSRDEDDELQPMKRTARAIGQLTPAPLTIPLTTMNTMPTLPPVLTPTSAPVSQGFSLPPPNMTTSNPISHCLPTPSSSQPSSISGSQLPVPAPLHAIYNRSSNWGQHQPNVPIPASSAGMYNAPSLPEIGRHYSSPFGVSSGTLSPAVSAYSVHTPQNHLSPSFFLANRNSPYRPVRSVSTLLIPPPSSSLQQQRSIPFDHMHYQPLGKGTSDRKTGLLPYIQPDIWGQGNYQPYYPPPQTFSS
ncbi:uncharacterized protein N7477_002699 [Penicillium maclennaniae]|uniref:uncharacterized protein n=1 Tax=Penicillium maclennaniae TaxID=1343394 RepID=UPI0025407504|nr:uncharacterized protein N7477_002699 [Penicillium maclennaniae]KAJ5677066.1 hypothetical protein N7477_002699 [Penicillium maclennaniae]